MSLGLTGQGGTSLVLVAMIVSSAVLGVSGEAKAEASLSALEKMLKNIARVRRDGTVVGQPRTGEASAS
jgi:Ca2+-transporting ATPase